MKDFDQNILPHFDTGYSSQGSPLPRRLVYGESGKGTEKPAEEAPTPEKTPIIDLNEYKKQVEFNDDQEKTLLELAQQDKVLAENFKQAIIESLNRAGYDKGLSDFWTELKTTYQCNKIEVKNGKIHFLKDSLEVAPHFSVIPIRVDLSRFRTDTPRTQYYNPESGLVSLKNWKETREITIKDIVINSRQGTEIKVTAPHGKTRIAKFDESGQKAYYTDGKKEVVKIYDGYKVELVRPTSTVTTETAQEEESAWGKYPVIGEFKYTARKERQVWAGILKGSLETVIGKEGLSAEDYIKIALGLKEDSDKLFDQSNSNLQKLRDLVRTKGYTYEKYVEFLRSHKAIREDRIMLLLDTDEIARLENNKKSAEERAKKQEYSQQLSASQMRERQKYFLPGNLEVAFNIRDRRLNQVVDDPALWRKAWDNNSIEGLTVLKGIIASEPVLFGSAAANPDALRERIRNAISNSRNDRIYFSDLIDDIADLRLKSDSKTPANAKNVAEIMAKQGNFLDWYNSMTDDQKDLDQIEKTFGLLKCLGQDVLQSATVINSGKDFVLLNITFENYAYTVKVNQGGAISGEETVKFYQFGTNTLLRDDSPYENGLRYTVGTLTSEKADEQSKVREEVRGALTPKIDYSNFTWYYNEHFNKDGTPKQGVDPTIQEWVRNVVIAGNRFLLQSQNLKFIEKSSGEMARFNYGQNHRGEIKDKKFLNIVGNDKKWIEEWNSPTLENVRQIKKILQEDPIFREISTKYPGEMYKRIQDAITTGFNRLLYIDDVIEYVLKGLPIPPSATEKKPLTEIKDSDSFREHYQELFDEFGNPKPDVEPAVAARYRAVIQACNKLVMAFEGRVEHITETSETTYTSQLLKQSQLPEQEFRINNFFSADEVFNNYQSDQIRSIREFNTLPKGTGLQIRDDLFGPELTPLVQRNKPAVFRAILQTFSLEQLIRQNNIVRTKPDVNQTPVYVINSLPDNFIRYMSGKKGNKTNLEIIINSSFDLSSRPEFIETLNPQNKLRRLANIVFPQQKGERTYEDVGEGRAATFNKDRAYNRVDYNFAHTQFLKEITTDGNVTDNIEEGKMMSMLNYYLQLFNSKLELTYGPEKAPKIRAEFEKAIGSTLPTIDTAYLEETLKDEKKKEVLLGALHDGFVMRHEQKVDYQRQKAIETLNTNYEKWKVSISEQELETLREALRKDLKMPEQYVPMAVEKMLPVWFGLGVDTATGTVGVGVGIGYPIRLIIDGINFGTVTVGAGVAAGITGIGQEGRDVGFGVGASTGITYKTPNLGPFALFAGAGVGVGIDTTGALGLGGVVGGGVSIEFGTAGSTKISADVGIAYIPGLPFPLPGLVMHFSKDHEASLSNLRSDVYEKFGIDKTETELTAAPNDAARKAIIGKNSYFRLAYERAYPLAFNQDSPEKIIKAYESFKAGIEESIREDYEPDLFWGITTLSIGFGFTTDPNSGESKFLFLLGGSLETGKEVKSHAFEGKSRDVMNQEIQIEHWRQLIDRNRQGQLTEAEKSEIQQLTSSGKLLALPGSNDLAIFIDRPAPSPTPTAETPTPAENLTERLEKQFNEKLAPLNLRVKYDANKKLFELLFNNWDNRTNYDIAVDTRMKTGGIVVEQGRLYLASTFDPGSNLTVLRSDYEYPFERAGKNYHTIVTISDSPLTPAHEIYQYAGEILSSHGGEWYRQNGLGHDQYAKQPASRFFQASGEIMRFYAFNADRYKAAEQPLSNDTPDTVQHISQLSVTTEEKGAVDEKKAVDFAKKFLSRHPLNYRQKSNKETLSNQFGDLNDLIIAEWKKDNNGQEPNPAELNLIRLKIMDESFRELGNIKDPKARELAFRNRLENTINYIIKPRFALLIKRNQEKYPAGDPRRINADAETICRVILARIRTIDVNSATGIPLSQIDRTSTVAGTLNIFGFRGNVYGADNKDPNQMMIGAGPDYARALRTNPTGLEADIARLIFEETSTMPARLEILPDTAVGQIDKTQAYDLLRADLTQKIVSNLFSPLSRNLFSTGVREEILRLAATKNALEFNGNSSRALYELQNLVEGIRKAEMQGETYYMPPNNPDYRFLLNYNTQDGVYKKCTNYSMWINESLTLQMRTSKIPRPMPELAAAYGLSTGTVHTKTGMEFTSINVAAAVAVTTKPDEPPPPPAGEKSEGSHTEGTGQGAADENTSPSKQEATPTDTSLPPSEDGVPPPPPAGGV